MKKATIRAFVLAAVAAFSMPIGAESASSEYVDLLSSEVRLDHGGDQVESTESSPVQSEESVKSRAQAQWKSFQESQDIDPRVDLLELEFSDSESRRPDAVAVKGISADPALLALFFAELAKKGITVEASIQELPDREALRGLLWAVVKVPRAKLYERSGKTLPTKGTKPVRELLMGERLRILDRFGAAEKSSDYLLVQCADGRIGLVNADDAAVKNEIAFVSWNRRKSVIVRVLQAPVYSPEGIELMRVGAGSVLMSGGLLDDKWVVYLPDGREARMEKAHAAEVQERQAREERKRRELPQAYLSDVARTAEQLAGISAASFGQLLPVTAYRLHDLIVPSEVDRLARLGAPLSGGKDGEELKPGDIVFFGEAEEPSHAGVWLGNGRFAALDASGERAQTMRLGGERAAGGKTIVNGGLGKFLWAVRPSVSELANPCMLSTRAHPFFQTPAVPLKRCRLR